MSDSAKQVLKHIENEGHFMIVGPKKGAVLVDAVKKIKARRILEVGTYVAYSSILMADAAGEETQIVTLEADPDHARMARENLEKAGVQDQVEIHEGDATQLIPTLSGMFDLMFIDAAKEEYLEYLTLAEDKLRKGALVVADNVKIFAQAMDDYLDYVRNSGKYESRTHDVGSDALEVSVKTF